jgi:hypothetical protein
MIGVIADLRAIITSTFIDLSPEIYLRDYGVDPGSRTLGPVYGLGQGKNKLLARMRLVERLGIHVASFLLLLRLISKAASKWIYLALFMFAFNLPVGLAMPKSLHLGSVFGFSMQPLL